MSDDRQVSVTLDPRGDRGHVAYVLLDNAARANSINSALADQFTAALETLAEDPKLLVCVISGAGDRSFAAGANVHELADLTPESGRRFITKVHRMNRSLRELPVPVIARINGACLGAGLELAAACDMRIAVESALLGMPEVDLGLPSVVEAALFPQLIGWGRTKQLIYTAENIDAQTALDWGLVESVVPQDQLDKQVEKMVGAIVKADPAAIRAQKRLMRRWESMAITDAIEEGIRIFAETCANDAPNELAKQVIARLRNKS